MVSIGGAKLGTEKLSQHAHFISHDRDFVSSLATRIIEFTPDGIIDYTGTYDEYLRAQALNQKARVA